MPLFEYRCSACDHLEEVLAKLSDKAPTTCPRCGKKKALRKELSKTSFQLKGGGWYKDLYSSTKPAAGSSESSGSSSESGGGSSESGASSPKGETHKSEAKGEAKSPAASDTKAAPAPSSTSSDTKPAKKAGPKSSKAA